MWLRGPPRRPPRKPRWPRTDELQPRAFRRGRAGSLAILRWDLRRADVPSDSRLHREWQRKPVLDGVGGFAAPVPRRYFQLPEPPRQIVRAWLRRRPGFGVRWS